MWNKFLAWLMTFPRDNCAVCKGAKGGARGAEQLVNGVVMCDSCVAERFELLPKLYDSPECECAEGKTHMVNGVAMCDFCTYQHFNLFRKRVHR